MSSTTGIAGLAAALGAQRKAAQSKRHTWTRKQLYTYLAYLISAVLFIVVGISAAMTSISSAANSWSQAMSQKQLAENAGQAAFVKKSLKEQKIIDQELPTQLTGTQVGKLITSAAEESGVRLTNTAVGEPWVQRVQQPDGWVDLQTIDVEFTGEGDVLAMTEKLLEADPMKTIQEVHTVPGGLSVRMRVYSTHNTQAQADKEVKSDG